MGTNYYLYKNDEAGTELHIGKSSSGWVFSLRVYPETGIRDLYDWIEIFLEEETIIRDEYGLVISTEKMLDVIMRRGRDEPLNWTENDFITNSAEQGPNNLVRYNAALMGSLATTVWPGEGTWDYINFEFF